MSLFLKNSKLLLLLVFVSVTITGSRAGVVILNGLSHEFGVNPGELYTGTIQLQNSSEDKQWVKLYQTDYFFNHKGESFYNDPGSQLRSNAPWIDISSTYFALAPREVREVNFQVRVPENDTLNGTYWSIIMVEAVEETDTTGLKNGVQVQSVMRYGVQVITNINDASKASLDFLDVSLSREETSNYLDVTIMDTGNKGLRTVLSAEFFNQDGVSLGVFSAERRRLFPETSATIRIELKGLEKGEYQVLLLADCMDDDIFGMNINIKL